MPALKVESSKFKVRARFQLGKFPAVEPQNGVAPANGGSTLFVGLDVHTDSIAVSAAPSDSTEVRRYGIIGGGQDDVLKLSKKLHAAHPQAPLKFCYEAGPHGYGKNRHQRQHPAGIIRQKQI